MRQGFYPIQILVVDGLKEAKKAQVKAKLGFETFSLYSAINVNTGSDVSHLVFSSL
ncbi:hypothetical protein P618_200679 [Holospora obtusa F1]|uniref:Uncharacterized protein n=1 Tax=Holospora obtusa F1 TaxID=1399147 RepID=W6TE18_HOLOB|nr:hypothetical protein P618_200679 [Holospora obtusa F1]